MSPQDLPTAKALNIIDQIADFGNPILVLSGGEPLYRADIFELAEYGTKRGLRVALATNGNLLSKIDALNRTTSWTYDALGRKVFVTATYKF